MIQPEDLRWATLIAQRLRRLRRLNRDQPCRAFHRLRFELLEDRRLLSTITWAKDVSGDWDVAANWTGGAVPGSSADAVIPYADVTVTHTGSSADSVNSLTDDGNLSISNGSLSLGTTSTISGGLTLSSGTLASSASLTVSGATTWTGGTISGGGTVTTQGTLSLGGTGNDYDEYLSDATLDNDGAATIAEFNNYTSHGLNLDNGALFDNQQTGSFTFASGAGILADSSKPTFQNDGTLTSSATATSVINAVFNQTSTGSTPIASGTIQLNGGGTVVGSIDPSGGTLDFNAGTFSLNASSEVSGAGTLAVSGATVNDAGSYNIAGGTTVSGGTLNLTADQADGSGKLTLSGGTLASPGSLTVSGATTWTGGTISGGGTVTTQGTLSLGGTGNDYDEYLSDATLDNDGAATIAEFNNYTNHGLNLDNGALFDNQQTGSFTFASGAGILADSSKPTFQNDGTLTSSATATSVINAVFNQTSTGSTPIASGTIQLNGGGTVVGSIDPSGGTLDFNAGTFSLNASSEVSGAGTLAVSGATVNDAGSYNIAGGTTVSGGTLNLTADQADGSGKLTLSGGTLASSGSLTVSGATTWTGGTISGGGTVTTQGTLSLGGTGNDYDEYLSDATLDNDGAATIAEFNNYTSHGLNLDNGALFDNQQTGSFTFASGAGILADSSKPTFQNDGTLTSSATATSVINAVFNQTSTGSTPIASGTIQLNGGGTVVGSIDPSAGTVDFNAGTFSLNASSEVSGAGTLAVSGATVNDAGSYNIAGGTTVSGGALSLTANQADGSGKLTLSGGTLASSGSLTVSGAATWTGGTISGGGTVTTQGTLSLGGTGNDYDEYLSDATLDNDGAATIAEFNNYTSHGLNLDNGALFDNQQTGSFTFASGAGILADSSKPTFQNDGTLTSSATATSVINAVFNQTSTGSTPIASGTIQLNGGGTAVGSIDPSGGTLDFNAGTFSLNASSEVSGAGTLAVSGATVNDAGSYNIAGGTTVSGGALNLTANQADGSGKLTLSGGTLASSGSLTVSGAATWTGGTISGGGTVTTQGTLSLGGTGNDYDEYLSDATLDNDGAATIAEFNNYTNHGLNLDNGALFDNQQTGSFTFASGAGILADSSKPTFQNDGTLTSSATATSVINAVFNQTSTGSTPIASGTIQLNGGGTAVGSIDPSGGTLDFNAGTFSLNASSEVSGAGTLAVSGATVNDAGSYNIAGGTTVSGGALNLTANQADGSGKLTLSGGTLASSGSLTVSGAATWTGGTISGGGTVTTQGTLSLGGTGNDYDEYLSDATLDNDGAATIAEFNNYTNHGLNLDNGALFDNQQTGSFTFASGAGILADSSKPTFQNDGTLTSSTTATSVINAVFNQTSTGSTPIASGTIQLNGGGTAVGSIDPSGGTLDFNAGTFSLNASSEVSGAGTLAVSGATVNDAGSYNIAGGTTVSGGALNLTADQADGSGKLTLSGGTLASSGSLTVSGAATWTGGTISGGGTVTTQGTLSLGGTGNDYDEYLSDATLDNDGAATIAEFNNYTNHGLNLDNGALFDNQQTGSFTFASGAGILADSSKPTFQNDGTLTSSATATSVINAVFNQTSTGSTPIASGTIQLNGGGTAVGSIDPSGGTLDFNAGTFSLNASSEVSGAGTLAVSGATVNDAGSYNIAGGTTVSGGALNLTANQADGSGKLTLSGGTLASSGSLTVSGAATWTGGTISGGGTVTTQGTLSLGGTGNDYDEYLSDATLDNDGAATIAEFNNYTNHGLNLDNGALFDNQQTGSFTFASGAGILADSSKPTFQNDGTLTSSTTATSVINAVFNQTSTGSTQVGSGTFTLTFNGGATFAGWVEAIGGGSLVMTTPPTNLASGTLTGATWIVGANSSMSLGANITTDATTIILNGTGAKFSNLSSLGTVATGGSLEILGGGSLTTAVGLDNAGTVELAPGTLNVTGNYTQESTGAYSIGIGGITAGSQFGQLNVTKSASLDGDLVVNLINNFTPSQGDSYTVLTFASVIGNFSAEFGLYFGGGEGFSPTFTPNSNPTALDLDVIAESGSTETTVQSSENPSNYGASVTFTVTVTPTISTYLVPTGTVELYDGTFDLGPATLNSGVASLTTSSLNSGVDSITAVYSGDSNFITSTSLPISQTVNLGGEVFNDLNGNGVLDPGDPGLVGWTVNAVDSSNNIVATAVTDSNGDYSLIGVGPGTYSIEDVAPAGYVTTTASSVTVTTTGGPSPSVINFGAFQTVTLSGEVYNDLNGNGTLDPGEPGLSDVTINLLASGSVIASISSDSNGNFAFNGVGPGMYTIEEEVPTNYVQTAPTSGSYSVTTTSGTNVAGQNFGDHYAPLLSPAAVLDNGQYGYSSRGLWTTNSGGFGGTYLTTPAATSATYAQWRLAVTAGKYDVWVTWVPASTDADNAPFRVSDNATVLGTVLENEKLAPFAGRYGGVYWVDLGSFAFNSGISYVRLSANADGTLAADAVMLVPSSSPDVVTGAPRSHASNIPVAMGLAPTVSTAPAKTTSSVSIAPRVVSIPGIVRNRLVTSRPARSSVSSPFESQFAVPDSSPGQNTALGSLDEILRQLAADVIVSKTRTK